MRIRLFAIISVLLISWGKEAVCASQDPSPGEVNKEFDSWVDDYLKEGKFNSIEDFKKPDMKKFLKNSIVREFLTRKKVAQDTSTKLPVYSSWERILLIELHKCNIFVPFRNDIGIVRRELIFTEITPEESLGQFLSATHHRNVRLLYEDLEVKAKSLPNNCQLSSGDIYNIGGSVIKHRIGFKKYNHPLNNKDEMLFKIFYSVKDHHAFTCFSVFMILDENRSVPLGTVLLNSQVDTYYFNQLDERLFNNYQYDEQKPNYMDHKDFNYSKKSPFLDGSIDLQRKDENCVFYTYDISKALVEHIKDKEFIELLEKIFVEDQEKTKKNWEDFGKKEFQDFLYKNLPQFFTNSDGTYTRISEEEIFQVSFKRRWNMGVDFFEKLCSEE